mmetsp:Transcript_7446/g.10815  ORF Transcript_7446/g.10815 Transcript_7446/m.10815 type:complete len:95 (+) Transcript_7446:475-759(+)
MVRVTVAVAQTGVAAALIRIAAPSATIIVVKSFAGCAGNTVAFGSVIIARTVAITVTVIDIVIMEVMHGSLGAALCVLRTIRNKLLYFNSPITI